MPAAKHGDVHTRVHGDVHTRVHGDVHTQVRRRPHPQPNTESPIRGPGITHPWSWYTHTPAPVVPVHTPAPVVPVHPHQWSRYISQWSRYSQNSSQDSQKTAKTAKTAKTTARTAREGPREGPRYGPWVHSWGARSSCLVPPWVHRLPAPGCTHRGTPGHGTHVPTETVRGARRFNDRVLGVTLPGRRTLLPGRSPSLRWPKPAFLLSSKGHYRRVYDFSDISLKLMTFLTF